MRAKMEQCNQKTEVSAIDLALLLNRVHIHSFSK